MDYDIKPEDPEFLRHQRELLAAKAECNVQGSYLKEIGLDKAGPDTMRRHTRELHETLTSLESAYMRELRETLEYFENAQMRELRETLGSLESAQKRELRETLENLGTA